MKHYISLFVVLFSYCLYGMEQSNTVVQQRAEPRLFDLFTQLAPQQQETIFGLMWQDGSLCNLSMTCKGLHTIVNESTIVKTAKVVRNLQNTIKNKGYGSSSGIPSMEWRIKAFVNATMVYKDAYLSFHHKQISFPPLYFVLDLIRQKNKLADVLTEDELLESVTFFTQNPCEPETNQHESLAVYMHDAAQNEWFDILLLLAKREHEYQTKIVPNRTLVWAQTGMEKLNECYEKAHRESNTVKEQKYAKLISEMKALGFEYDQNWMKRMLPQVFAKPHN